MHHPASAWWANWARLSEIGIRIACVASGSCASRCSASGVAFAPVGIRCSAAELLHPAGRSARRRLRCWKPHGREHGRKSTRQPVVDRVARSRASMLLLLQSCCSVILRRYLLRRCCSTLSARFFLFRIVPARPWCRFCMRGCPHGRWGLTRASAGNPSRYLHGPCWTWYPVPPTGA